MPLSPPCYSLFMSVKLFDWVCQVYWMKMLTTRWSAWTLLTTREPLGTSRTRKRSRDIKPTMTRSSMNTAWFVMLLPAAIVCYVVEFFYSTEFVVSVTSGWSRIPKPVKKTVAEMSGSRSCPGKWYNLKFILLLLGAETVQVRPLRRTLASSP